MPNTSETGRNSNWIDLQEAFIASLRSNPLVVVLRPNKSDFEEPYSKKPLFLLIEQLHFEGVRHIEIAWSPKMPN